VMSGSIADPIAKMYGWGLFTTPVYNKEGHIQGCIAYPSSMELGPSIKTAQAFGILLVIFTSSIFLGLILVQFFLERGAEIIYHVIRVFLPSAFCCQLLTFASFASSFCTEMPDEEDGQPVPATCVPGGAGVVAIFNLVAIIIMTIIMSMVSPPEHPVFQLYGTGNSLRVKGGSGSAPSGGSGSRGRRKKPRIEKVSLMEPQRPGKEKIKTTIVNGPQIRKTIKEITHPNGSQTITTTVEEIRGYDEDYDDCSSLGDDASATVLEVL
jgi:hypothetical protein